MTLEKAKETILHHMKKGETEQAIHELLDITKAQRSDLYDEAILLASKRRNLERDRMLGTAGSESLSVREAQIDEAVINLALQLTKAPADPAPAPDPTAGGSQKQLWIGAILTIAIAIVLYFGIRSFRSPAGPSATEAKTETTERTEQPTPPANQEPRQETTNDPAQTAPREKPVTTDREPAAPEVEITTTEDPPVAFEPTGPSSWGTQPLGSGREALKFLLKTGGYTTEVTEVEMTGAGKADGTGFIAFYRSEPGGVRGNWSVESRKHPDEVIQFLNGPLRKIEEVEITAQQRAGALLFHIFSQPGTRRNAPAWRWKQLGSAREVVQLLNGAGTAIRQAEVVSLLRNDRPVFLVFYQAGEPLHPGKWKGKAFSSGQAARRFMSDPAVARAELTTISGKDGRTAFYLFYQ